MKWKAEAKPGQRIHFMDELRGFAVLCMIFYHGFYTFSFLLGWKWSQWLLDFFTPAEPWFAGLFVFVSGIAGNLTRSNLKRGLKLAAAAVVVSLVTIFVVPDEGIYFGILHLLSVSMIVTGLSKRFLDRVPLWVGTLAGAGLFVFTWGVQFYYLGFLGQPLIWLPLSWYQANWLMPFGFHNYLFFSSDYFPIFPWLFLFLSGVFFGRYAAQGRFPKWTYQNHIRPLSFLGRHALIFYLAHQPVIYGAGMLIQWLT